MNTFKLLSALCCIINVYVPVQGEYVVEMEFHGYSNPTGRCADCPIPKGRKVHSCCDNFAKTTCTRGARCDSYFYFCLRALGDTGTTNGCTSFGSKSTFANINDAPLKADATGTVLGLDNPLQLPGLTRDYTGVQVYIEVIDADFTPRSAPNELVDIMLIDLSPSSIGSPPKRQNYTGAFDFVTMDLSITPLCAGNRQPPDCVQCAFGFTGDNCDVRSGNIDDCAGVNCSGRGICMDGIDSFTCLCDPGFTGRLCNIKSDSTIPDIIDCSSNPCRGRGQCVQNGLNNFLCICERGFTGSLCQEQIGTTIDVDDCVGVTCSGNGACVDGINSFSCDCSVGFTGRLCETNIDECLPNPCGINGVCVDGVSTFLCVCDPGFTGKYCQQKVDQCAGVTCSGNGRCVEGEYTFHCICDPGFAGRLCSEVNINDCTFNTCINGQCVVNNATGVGECTCAPGFSGERCQTNIDDCDGVDCSGNGVCVDGNNTFSCECNAGFEGQLCNVQSLRLDSDNNCSSSASPCSRNEQCVDGQTNYTCQCSPGSQCPQADTGEGDTLVSLAPLIGGSVGTLLLVIFTLVYVIIAVVAVCRIRRRRRNAKEYELI